MNSIVDDLDERMSMTFFLAKKARLAKLIGAITEVKGANKLENDLT